MKAIREAVDRGDGFFINPNPECDIAPLLAGRAFSSDRPELWSWWVGHDFPESRSPQFGATRLPFWCYRTLAGDRMFLPVWGWQSLVRIAAQVGVGVLSREGRPREVLDCHTAFIVLFEYARRTEEFLSFHFQYVFDLEVRGSKGLESVLPEGLGVPAGGSGKPWRPFDVIERGRALCLPGEDTATAIGYGLHAAAGINPWTVPEESHRLKRIHSALFAGTEDVSMTFVGDVFAELVERYVGRVHREQAESGAAFRTWHSGPKTDVPRLVARAVVRKLKYAVDVRTTLLHLCWRSFLYTGAALSNSMAIWLFKAGLAEQLTDREIALFNLMYRGHEAFGGLPLAILFDRFDLLEPWIEGVITNPENPRLAEFYTLLGFYGVMVREKRESERNAKRPTCSLHGTESHPNTTGDSGTARFELQDTIDHLARELARSRALQCRCKQPVWKGLAEPGRSGGNQPGLAIRCSTCKSQFRPDVSNAELAVLAQMTGCEL